MMADVFSRETANALGPVVTTAAVLGVLAIYAVAALHKAQDSFSVALKIGAAGCGAGAILACVLTHIVDPGTPQAEPNDPGPPDPFNEEQRTRRRVLPDGTIWTQKWCRDCRLWRPHRCGHCHACGRCILRLDHHCAWMGTCVGERNERFFTAFLYLAGFGIQCLLVLAVHRLATLGCFSTSACWSDTWEPLVILGLFCCCPSPCPNMAISGCMLNLGGAHYTAQMLTDADVHSWDGYVDGAIGQLRRLAGCPGAKTYCCGPVSLKSAWSLGPAQTSCPARMVRAEHHAETVSEGHGDDGDESSPLSGTEVAVEIEPGATQLGAAAVKGIDDSYSV